MKPNSTRIHRLTALSVDERGQAMTEFAIVMPILLLFFLGMIQYFQVFRAAQLANYAAYCAARAYAVHASVDGESEAEQVALDAAALALAPVGRLVPGEVSGLNPLTGGSTGPGALAEGYLTARYFRLNSKAGGGSLTVQTSKFKGLPKQVDVQILYPQPIFIPGFAGLWNMIGGSGHSIHEDLKPLSKGLDGVVGIDPGTDEHRPEWFHFLFPSFRQRLLGEFDAVVRAMLPYPYVTVMAKCSMGYEDWGNLQGKPYPQYRPRIPRSVVDAAQSAEDGASQEIGANFDKVVGYLKAAATDEDAKCREWAKARQSLNAAKEVYDTTPEDPPAAKQQAMAILNSAKEIDARAKNAYLGARATRRSQQGALEGEENQIVFDPECVVGP